MAAADCVSGLLIHLHNRFLTEGRFTCIEQPHIWLLHTQKDQKTLAGIAIILASSQIILVSK